MAFCEKIILASAVAALILNAAAPAAATPTFPPRIAAELGLPNPPACSLCHEGATQKGTVITPFGASMRSRGLVAYDEGSLTNALLALEGEGTDSDGDGVGDIEELLQGADPNEVEGAGGGGDAAIVPEYGCSAGTRGGSGSGMGGAAFVFVLVTLCRRISTRGGRE
ncbi:MAG: hypothetical protein HUU21_05970 [Polyangiaceae bacterium]|nr:hypothetical protein [Polyangiaceae bacterium]